MEYDDNFETLDKLLNAINEAIQEKVEMGIPATCGDCNHDMFDNDKGEFEDLFSIMNSLDEDLERSGSLLFIIRH